VTLELPPLILGIIGGVISWFVTQFIAEPLRRFLGMRRDIAQRLLVYGNVRGPRIANEPRPLGAHPATPVTAQEEARLREAKDKLRELATQTLSFIQTDSVATKLLQLPWLWRYDLRKAGMSLLLLSLDIGVADENERAAYQKDIEDALRLKPLK
jgi:hypothetical protein